jgi:hypothetical protein
MESIFWGKRRKVFIKNDLAVRATLMFGISYGQDIQNKDLTSREEGGERLFSTTSRFNLAWVQKKIWSRNILSSGSGISRASR